MTARVVERSALTVMGIELRINPMAADWSDIWRNKYEPRLPEIEPFATDEACLGLYFGTGEAGMVDFVAGRPIKGVTVVPEGLVLREVPGATEAVFECTMETIGATWHAIFRDWLPASEYVADEGLPCYERFAPGCHEGTVPVTIHVPVKKKA